MLKDVGDTMNLSALPASSGKNVYSTCGLHLPLGASLLQPHHPRRVLKGKVHDSIFVFYCQ